MNKLMILLVSILVLAGSGCPKEGLNPDEDSPNFVGTWYRGDATNRLEDAQGYQTSLLIEGTGNFSLVRHINKGGRQQKTLKIGTYTTNGPEITLFFKDGGQETYRHQRVKVNEHLMMDEEIVYTRWRG